MFNSTKSLIFNCHHYDIDQELIHHIAYKIWSKMKARPGEGNADVFNDIVRVVAALVNFKKPLGK